MVRPEVSRQVNIPPVVSATELRNIADTLPDDGLFGVILIGKPPILNFEEYPLTINPVLREVSSGNIFCNPTNTEFNILHILAKNAGVVLSRERVLDEVWGPHHYSHGHAIDVHASNLRKHFNKLEIVSPIRTIRKIGFVFDRIPRIQR